MTSARFLDFLTPLPPLSKIYILKICKIGEFIDPPLPPSVWTSYCMPPKVLCIHDRKILDADGELGPVEGSEADVVIVDTDAYFIEDFSRARKQLFVTTSDEDSPQYEKARDVVVNRNYFWFGFSQLAKRSFGFVF